MAQLIMLNQQAVKYHENLKPKRTRVSRTKWLKHIETICEEQYSFRGYEILNASDYGNVNKVGVHVHIEEFEDIEYLIGNAIQIFCRKGHPCIYFYI
jgi:hypothetical protein